MKKCLAFTFFLLIKISFVISQPVCATDPVIPKLSEAAKALFTQKWEEAFNNYKEDSSNADAIIWYGRRTAYLGRYKESIEIFTKGIKLHPNDARMYRHRGHRYITLRCLDQAIADFEKAAKIITNKPDEIEPDGLPNAKNQPTSTLQSNIWYHLGLSYYLKGEYGKALEAYRACLKVSGNPDMYVATVNWLYVTLLKLKKEKEAETLLSTVKSDAELIENQDYLRILRLYKKELKAADLQAGLLTDSSSLSNASMGYGLGNYYLLTGDNQSAKKIFQKIVAGDQWASFGFIAAENELKKSALQ